MEKLVEPYSRPSHVQAVQEKMPYLAFTCDRISLLLHISLWACAFLGLAAKEACDINATNQQLAHETGLDFFRLSKRSRERDMHAGE